jgi:hypothetical protein
LIPENNTVPFSPHKPNDFLELEKLRIKFNHNTALPTPITIILDPTTTMTLAISIPTIIGTTTTYFPISTTTIPTSSTTTILTQIATTHFDRVCNHPLDAISIKLLGI